MAFFDLRRGGDDRPGKFRASPHRGNGDEGVIAVSGEECHRGADGILAVSGRRLHPPDASRTGPSGTWSERGVSRLGLSGSRPSSRERPSSSGIASDQVPQAAALAEVIENLGHNRRRSIRGVLGVEAAVGPHRALSAWPRRRTRPTVSRRKWSRRHGRCWPGPSRSRGLSTSPVPGWPAAGDSRGRRSAVVAAPSLASP